MYNDFLSKVLEPDTISPFQFYGSKQLSGQVDGQKKLMLAILQDAVECLEKYRQSRNCIQQELYQDALDWVRDPAADWLFCFTNVCDFLGFDPTYMRQSLLEREEKASKKGGAKGVDMTRGERVAKLAPALP